VLTFNKQTISSISIFFIPRFKNLSPLDDWQIKELRTANNFISTGLALSPFKAKKTNGNSDLWKIVNSSGVYKTDRKLPLMSDKVFKEISEQTGIKSIFQDKVKQTFLIYKNSSNKSPCAAVIEDQKRKYSVLILPEPESLEEMFNQLSPILKKLRYQLFWR